MEKLPKITEYTDYSRFLKDKFQHFKSKKRGFTYQSCATKIGATTSYFKNVTEGRKRIGLSRVSKIAALFELDEFETQYFSILVVRELIEDEKTKAYFTSILSRFRSIALTPGTPEDFKFSMNDRENSQNPFFDWLYMSLIELMNFPDFEDNDSWFLEKLIDVPHLTAAQIRAAINDLLKMEVIEKTRDRYVYRGPTSSTQTVRSPDSFDMTRFKNLRGLVQKTWEVLGSAQKYRPSWYFQGAFAVNWKDSELLELTVRRHQEEIMQIVSNSKNPTRVIAISNNMFTLAKPKDGADIHPMP